MSVLFFAKSKCIEVLEFFDYTLRYSDYVVFSYFHCVTLSNSGLIKMIEYTNKN